MPSNAAYQIIKDHLSLEGKPIQNMATFISSWMEPDAEKLLTENLGKNFADKVKSNVISLWDSVKTLTVGMIYAGGVPTDHRGAGQVPQHTSWPLQRP